MTDSHQNISAATCDALRSIHDAVNALGGRSDQDNPYDQGIVDTVAKVLEIIEKAQSGDDAQSVQVTPIAWTNKMQLSFLKDPAYAEIPMAMWGKRGGYADIPLYAAQPPAAPVETKATPEDWKRAEPWFATKSAPSLLASQHAELLPKREPAGGGADTQCSAGTADDARACIASWEETIAAQTTHNLVVARSFAAETLAILKASITNVPQPPSKMLTMLAILDAAGGQTEASDSKWCWLNYFCEDTDSTDTFNQAVDAKLIRVSHDSRFDSSTVYLTEAGRAAASALSRPESR